MKAKTRPLPTPWNADAAILHLYCAWSNQGRVPLWQIALLNPNMVGALVLLWQQDHQQVSSKVPEGVLGGMGTWRLLQMQDGSGLIIIEHLEMRGSRRISKGTDSWGRYHE